VERCTSAAEAASEAHDAAAREHAEHVEQLNAADKKAAPELQERVDASAVELAAHREAAHDARRALASIKRRRDAEIRIAFAKIQSERLLLATASCASAFQETKDETKTALDFAQLEAVRALKRAQARRDLGQRGGASRNAPRKLSADEVFDAQQFMNRETSAAVTAIKARLAQQYTRISTLFKQWDVDHSSCIDREELHQVLCHLQIAHTQHDLTELFEDIDADGSGTIDSAELHDALRSFGTPKPQNPMRSNAARLAMPKRAEQSDHGSDGERIAINTLKRSLKSNLTRVKDLFTQWDVDGDGQISIRELERALAGLCIPIDKPAVKRLFKLMDGDNSGTIDFRELEQLLRADGAPDVVSLARNGPIDTGMRTLTVAPRGGRPQTAPGGLAQSTPTVLGGQRSRAGGHVRSASSAVRPATAQLPNLRKSLSSR